MMTDQHPAVAYLLAAHERAVAAARVATQGRWVADGGSVYVGHPTDLVVDWAYGDNAEHIALHDPASALLRVEAEREILDEHAGTWGSGEPEYDYHYERAIVGPSGRTRYVEERSAEPNPPYICTTCPGYGYPCRTVLLLAKAWGWEADDAG